MLLNAFISGLFCGFFSRQGKHNSQRGKAATKTERRLAAGFACSSPKAGCKPALRLPEKSSQNATIFNYCTAKKYNSLYMSYIRSFAAIICARKRKIRNCTDCTDNEKMPRVMNSASSFVTGVNSDHERLWAKYICCKSRRRLITVSVCASV